MKKLRNTKIVISLFLITSLLFNNYRLSIVAIEENLDTNVNYSENVEKTTVIYSTQRKRANV